MDKYIIALGVSFLWACFMLINYPGDWFMSMLRLLVLTFLNLLTITFFIWAYIIINKKQIK
jgi:hypothetical protein